MKIKKLSVAGECSTQLKRQLSERFPQATVIVYQKSPRHFRAWLSRWRAMTPEDEADFDEAIRSLMDERFRGKVSTPTATIVFE